LIRFGGAANEYGRLADYMILPSLAGFEFSPQQHHSSSGQPAQEAQSGDRSGATDAGPTPEAQQPPARGGQDQPPGRQAGQPAATGQEVPQGDQEGAGEQEPAEGSPSPTPPIEGSNTGSAPAGSPVATDGTSVPGMIASDSDPRLTDEDSQRLDLAMAGLLGAQAWHGRQRAGVSARSPAPSAGSGNWIHRGKAGEAAAGAVLLDRRAQPRADTAVPRIAAGAIEQAARNWLDGGLGMHTSVQTRSYAARPGLSIDWGEGAAPAAKTDVKRTSKP
jgi:hypothetical protein